MFKKLILLIVCCIQSTIFTHEWSIPNQAYKDITTIFYPGMLSSETQCAKYIGGRALTTQTNEKVCCKKAIDVILHPFTGPEVECVSLKNLEDLAWYQWLNPQTWLLKGQEYFITKKHAASGLCVIQKNNNGHTIETHSLKLSKLNFGQELDMHTHDLKINTFHSLHPNTPIILWGISRGSATTFNAAAKNNKAFYEPSSPYSHVKLIVLEGCYDSLANTLRHDLPVSLQKMGAHKIAHFFVEKCTGYKRAGISPMQQVKNFPADVPVVFITSQSDRLVSSHCTKRLAKALAKKINGSNLRANDVYLLELEHSSHAGYANEHPQDALKYQQFMHALYKKLDLPYIQEFADAGIPLIEQALIS